MEEEKKASIFSFSAGRLACALSEAGVFEEGIQSRQLASVSANAIDRAIRVRECFHRQFHAYEGDDVRFYDSNHRYGTGLCEPINEDWFVEAQIAGELFPVRAQDPLLITAN